MAVNPNSLEWRYRTFVGSDSSDQKASYSFNFNSGGQEYTFIPESVIERGVDTGDKNYVFPAFLNKDNLTKLGETGQYIDLNGVSWYGDYLKDNVGASTKGFLIPANSFDFGVIAIVPNNVKGVGNTKEGPAYILETPEGKLGQYLASDGKVTTLTKTRGSSLLGNVFGDWVDDFTTSTGIAGVAGEINDFFQTDLGKAIKLASLASNVYDFATAPDVSEVGGVTGPDNIDVGGGFNPAAGATAAELEAARLALDGTVSSPVYSPELPVGTELPPLPEPTIDEVINKIAPPPVVSAPPLEIAPPVEVGPELLGEAGGNTFPLEIEPVGSGPIPLGDAPTVNDITSAITGNADRAAMNSNAGYGEALTSAQIDAVNKAVASGWTVSEALNAARAGLFVNAIVGDPLGLGGGQPENAGGGSIGFEQVPIPAEWKSPTYAAPSAPIDLSSIFTDQNLLNGTQWRGLPAQQNVSFNDIFLSGQQQTPMGNMVDINQIVSAIIGQNTASQKPA